MPTGKLVKIRIGLRKRRVEILMRLRWDKSPKTCEAIVKRLPIESQVWHARSAGPELFSLIPVIDEQYVGEWRTLYPAPGDLMYLPIEPGFGLPPGAPTMDTSRGLIDIAYFYERGSTLIVPTGIALGNIFATADSIDDIDIMAKACTDVWLCGVKGETLYLEASQ